MDGWIDGRTDGRTDETSSFNRDNPVRTRAVQFIELTKQYVAKRVNG